MLRRRRRKKRYKDCEEKKPAIIFSKEKTQWDQRLPHEIYKKNQKENAEYFQKLWGDPLELEKQSQLDYHKQINKTGKNHDA